MLIEDPDFQKIRALDLNIIILKSKRSSNYKCVMLYNMCIYVFVVAVAGRGLCDSGRRHWGKQDPQFQNKSKGESHFHHSTAH